MFGINAERDQNQNLKNSNLFDAIAVGDLLKVKAALAAGAELDASSYFYIGSPLAHALMYCPSLDVFKYLLVCKANPNFVFLNGETLLGMAILKSTPERVGLLVEYGANPNQPNKQAVTPLQIAKEMPDTKMVMALLDAGANINWNNKYFSQYLKEDLFRLLKSRINFYIDKLVKSIEQEDETKKCIGVLNRLTKNIEGGLAIYPAQPGRFPADDLKNARQTTRNTLTEKIISAINELKELESLQNAKVGLQAIMDNLEIIKGLGSVRFTKKASMAALEKCMEVLNEKIKQAEEKARQLELEKTVVSLFDHLEGPDVENIINDINSRMKAFNTNHFYLQRLHTAFMRAFREKSDQMAKKGFDHINVQKVFSNVQKIAEKLDMARWVDESWRDAAAFDEWSYSLKAKLNIQSDFLLEAVRAADLDRMRDALSLGANINYVGLQSGETPLTLAVLLGRAEVVAFLIENGADVNEENKHNESAIFLAAKNGFSEAMIALLNANAQVDWDRFEVILSPAEFRQLCAASVNASFVMIDPMAPVNDVVDESELHTQEEALFTAVNEGDVDVVEGLFLEGVNLNVQGPFHTPLTSAASKNKEAVVEKLIYLGANIDWGALSKIKSMKDCVVRVLNKMIFQDIDDLFQFKYEPNNHLELINQETAHFASLEFKDERADIRKYFVKKMNEKRSELACVIDAAILKGVRDRFCLIEKTMAIIQSPEGEKEKDSMTQLRGSIHRLNERMARLEGQEKINYQPGLTQFASVKAAAADKQQPELGPDAGFTL